jgi:hypothetical protein
MGCASGSRVAAALVVAFSLAGACERRPLDETAPPGAGGLAGASGPAGAAGASGRGGAGGAGAGGLAGDDGICPGHPWGPGGRGGAFAPHCADGVDNDGDGKIDYDDPECVGGNDNDESSFGWGIPVDNPDLCKSDCFWDGNSAMGDDNCVWQLKCDPLNTNPSCPHDPAYATAHPAECSLSASQTQVCLDRCGRLVPNGCDCFGCCAVPGLAQTVRLTYACTAADFGDPQKCPPCTQVTQCVNPCERCELCIGKPALPDDCAPMDGCAPYICPAGAIACGEYGIAPWRCPAGTSCVTGCCLPRDPVF